MKKNFQKAIPYAMRGASCILLFRMELPAGIFLYISTNTSLAFLQNCFLRSKAAEWVFNLPPMVTEQDKKLKAEQSQILKERLRVGGVGHFGHFRGEFGFDGWGF